MVAVVGIVLGIVALVVLAAIVVYSWWSYFDRLSEVRIARFASNPQVICGSSSCNVALAWRVENLEDDQTVSLTLRKPNGDVVSLSNDPARENPDLRLGADDGETFSEEGQYVFELAVLESDGDESRVVASESRSVTFYPGPTFAIQDVWNTGLAGGELSENETVATRSFVISENPNLGVTSLDGKLPGILTVCPKGMVLESVRYSHVQLTNIDDSVGVRELDVTVRRPNATDHFAAATLDVDDSLDLPEPVLVDDGIEVLSVMRSSDDRRLTGAEWGLTYTFRCV